MLLPLCTKIRVSTGGGFYRIIQTRGTPSVVVPSDSVDGEVSIVEMESGLMRTLQFEEWVAVADSVVVGASVVGAMEPAV